MPTLPLSQNVITALLTSIWAQLVVGLFKAEVVVEISKTPLPLGDIAQ